jgi:crotonobetainyl-CoA:carnitine CoA-transferase CaiB-like acyl-CoA transferase
LQALGRPDLIDLCLRGPGPHQAPVMDFLAQVFREKSLADWLAWLDGRDLCYGPALSFPEMLDDAHPHARGMVLTDAAGRRHIGPPIAFAAEPAQPVLRAPGLGEHTDAVLRGRAGSPPQQEDR